MIKTHLKQITSIKITKEGEGLKIQLLDESEYGKSYLHNVVITEDNLEALGQSPEIAASSLIEGAAYLLQLLVEKPVIERREL